MRSSSLVSGSGGVRRPILLIVSGDADRWGRWALSFAAEGACTMRCAGPTVSCALLRGLARCPLLDEADAAVYDVASLNDEFVLTLARRYPHLLLAFARDSAEGKPVVERIKRDRRSEIDACFGSF